MRHSEGSGAHMCPDRKQRPALGMSVGGASPRKQQRRETPSGTTEAPPKRGLQSRAWSSGSATGGLVLALGGDVADAVTLVLEGAVGLPAVLLALVGRSRNLRA